MARMGRVYFLRCGGGFNSVFHKAWQREFRHGKYCVCGLWRDRLTVILMMPDKEMNTSGSKTQLMLLQKNCTNE